jgi:hypothetical protein
MNTLSIIIDPDLVFSYCQDIYKEYNFDLRFPKSRDVKKTYQYRYLLAICKKFTAWGLDGNEVKRFLRIAINNSFKHKTIKKGLSALHQKNLLEISYEQLISASTDKKQAASTAEMVLAYLVKFCGIEAPESVLRRRENIRSNMVITNLYQAGKISVEFMAVNDICRKIVIGAIDGEEQDAMFLPTLGKIYKINTESLSNKDKFTNFDNIKKWGSLV